MQQIYDYVIVGAGMAGCLLANRLTANKDVSVCLIEAGPPDTHRYIDLPAGFIKIGHHPDYTWDFKTEPNEQINGRQVITRMGKTLGGSSSINGFNYTRGSASDYDGWSALGNPGWSYEDVLPYFRRSERRMGECDPRYRGTDGELPITDCDWRHPLCDAFIEGAGQQGLPKHVDYNAASQRGAGYYQRWIHEGKRVSAARAFLDPIKSRSNLTVITRTLVTEILFKDKQAVGVAFRDLSSGQSTRVGARREVILSSGAANTPKLLQLSGVGDQAMLSEFDIPMVHHSPGVGKNFRDHFMVRSVVRVKGVTTLNRQTRGLSLVGQAIKWSLRKPSVLAISPSVCFAFMESSPAAREPDLQLHFSPGSFAQGIAGKLDDFDGMTLGFYQSRPSSQGEVRIQSKDPDQLPWIQPNYIVDAADRQVVINGLRRARELLHSEALAPYIERDEFPPADAQTDEELLQCAREQGGTAWHFMGTCKMGPDHDPLAVVDASLRVKGIKGVRVVDASIMPTMPAGNTGAPTMMIAEKAADMILAGD